MDLSHLQQETKSSSHKGATKQFVPHAFEVKKPRSIPATGEPPKMKPVPNSRFDWNKTVTKGRFQHWEGESSLPVKPNNSWWKGEAAGLSGSVQEQRRQRAAAQSRAAKKQEQERSELLLTKDRFGRDVKDAITTGAFDPERRPNATVSKKVEDAYEAKRLKPAKQIGVRCQYIDDCTDVIHRNWMMRYTVPPQAREGDAVNRMIANETANDSRRGAGGAGAGAGGGSSSSVKAQSRHTFADDGDDGVGTYRVLPPLKEVEKVFHMNHGYSTSGARFSSPYAKNERSAREGYVTNDSFIGRTTPVGERGSASNAPPLATLALATADAKLGEGEVPYAQMSSANMNRKVQVQKDGDDGEEQLPPTASSSYHRRVLDQSVTKLCGVARERRVTAHSPFNAVPAAALAMIPPAGI